jgi:hypothetical protein
MTEAEWDSCIEPQKMLEFVRQSGRSSDRKLRLFACGYWRLSLPHLYLDQADHQQVQQAVEVAERYADGLASAAELAPLRPLRLGVAAGTGRSAAERALPGVAERMGWLPERPTGRPDWDWTAGERFVFRQAEAERQRAVREFQLGLLRDVFGPLPFRKVRIHPSVRRWGDGTVVSVATAIYDERAFDRLPILADALEDAGCTNPDLLGHLRGPEPHARGCWPVDLLLGKE